MTDHFPAAQAVLTACNDAVERLPLSSTKPEQFSIALIAAAMRAAADRVVPEQGCQIYGLTERENERQQVREEILSIAAELEAR